MAKLHALIFDVDGTLAETEDLHRISFNAAFAEVGLDWEWDRALYRELLAVTGGKERIRYYIHEFNGKIDLTPDGVRALHERKTAIYVARMAGGALGPRPGILRLIHEAREAGLKCAIATTTSRANVDILLQAAFAPNAETWFAAVAAGDEVEHKKPAPDVYALTLERLGLSAQECIAIEDSRNGLESARRAGLNCIITISPYTEGQDFSSALKTVAHLGDLETPNPELPGGMVTLAMLEAWHAGEGA